MTRANHAGSSSIALCMLAAAGCGGAPGAPFPAGEQAAIAGTVVSVDRAPWAYDGDAVVEVDTRDHGRISVRLPARWNLCAAPAVDVDALAVGARVRAVGTASAEGALVVCERETHRLAPAD